MCYKFGFIREIGLAAGIAPSSEKRSVMQNHIGNRPSTPLARSMAALCGALAVAAGSALPASTETVLYSFCSKPSCDDGNNPVAGLIADGAVNLYGTTPAGGASGNGLVFRLSLGGIETVLHSFCSKPLCKDGHSPDAGLYADKHGNLYGTTASGGALNFGVVFELSPPIPPATAWQETVLHIFKGSDGGGPLAGLYADKHGNLYGTTALGGASGSGCGGSGCGTVFKITDAGFVP
jgi:uncharacterized repeat protein (TIGR03803 family)